MNYRNILSILMIATLFGGVGCTDQPKEKNAAEHKAQQIVDAAIGFHGLGPLDHGEVSFTFRTKSYTYKKQGGLYEYTRTQTDSTGAEVYDVMNNDGLTRYINGEKASITEERKAAYTRSVNSVIYFLLLPYGLNDAAVNKSYHGEVVIKDKTYHKIKITFDQEGGGEDFEDVFLYWFDKEDYSMDYFAYLYHTDGGGIRFREAIDQRRVNGMLFQDYINMKPETKDIDFMTIDELYENGELRILSKIINEELKAEKG